MKEVLVKGWPLPECCTTEETVECVFAYTCLGEDYICQLTGEDLVEGKRGKRCPLIEVPTHGDLKDFNDILSIFDKVIHYVDDDTNGLLADLLVKIGYAPTVLEATEGGDDGGLRS